MGRCASFSGTKNVHGTSLNATVQAHLERTANINSFVQGEITQSATLNAYTALFTQYLLSASLNSYVSQSTLMTGLMAYYKLDGNSTDSLGTYNGTDTAVTYPAGRINQGANFSSTTTSRIEVGSVVLGAQFTYSAWLYVTDWSSYYGVLNGPGAQLNLYAGSGRLNFYNGGDRLSTGAIPLNTLTHVVVTGNGTTVKFFINGAQDPTTHAISPSVTLQRIGCDMYWPALHGTIDEVGVWNRALTQAEVTELFNKTAGNQYPFGNTAPITTALAAYWKLDGNSTDSLGSYNGTDTGITYSGANGKINNGAGFVSGSRVAFSSLALGTQFTLSAWIKPAAYPGYMGILTQASGAYGFYVTPSGTLLFYDGSLHNSTSTVPIGVFTHVVVVANGVTVKFYVNGVVDVSSYTMTPTLTVVQIGNDGVSQYFSGAIDEVGTWTRALAEDEVLSLYNAGSGIQYPFGVGLPLVSNLRGYWKLDGDSTDALGVNNGSDTGITYAAGKIGSAAGFVPAASSLINCGTNASLEVTGAGFTLSAWVKPSAFSQNYQSWILRANGANKPLYRFGQQLMTSNWGFTFYNGSTYRDYWVTTSALTTGVWQHVAVVYNSAADTYSFYKNGALVYAPTGVLRDFVSGAGTFYIGRNIEDNSYYDGSIDEVAVWGRALLPSDITTLYNAGAGLQYPF